MEFTSREVMPISKRRIDHLVIAVRDLEAAAEFYRRLGFKVGQRNRHPWGTENRLIQFRSSFLELITVAENAAAIPPYEPGRFSFGAFVRDYLEQGEGCAMCALDSSDARADSAEFSRLGIGGFEPFFFERKGRRPDGGETRVAFTLAFAMDPKMPNAGFFVCQQHNPENFWSPDFQNHPIGAAELATVTLGASNPADRNEFLSAFTGISGTWNDRGGMTFSLRDGGRLLINRHKGAASISAFTVAVRDLARASEQLMRTGVRSKVSKDRITVDARDAFGVTIGLVPQEIIEAC